MPKLLIVIGATRPGRAGIKFGTWFAERARAHGGYDVEVADLAEIDLPLLDEPKHPKLGQYEQEHTKAWSAQVAASDAFVFVTSEYNHGYPAPLKNAIDFLHAEWAYKPCGFVSYGGVAAGTRALQQLKPVVAVLRMTPVTESVNIPFHTQFIADDGTVHANDVMETAADAMLDELLKVGAALQPLRG